MEIRSKIKPLSSGKHFPKSKVAGVGVGGGGVGRRGSSRAVKILIVIVVIAQTTISHYMSMGSFGCHGYQNSKQTCPEPLYSQSQTPIIVPAKCDQDWATGLGDILVR